MLDVVNERIMENGEDPVAFDNDCREGIWGACGMMIMELRTGRSGKRRPASFTSGASRMGIPSILNPGVPRHFP
jgi:succinate dehydrogenase / fumarate reductase iron-sulfur subunit